jgi:hypothetical protein
MELGLIQGDHAIPVLAAWVATLTIIVVKMSCAAGVAGWLWSEDHIKRAAAGDAEALSGDPRHRGQRLGLGVNSQVDRAVRFRVASKGSDESSMFSCWSSSTSSDWWVWL